MNYVGGYLFGDLKIIANFYQIFHQRFKNYREFSSNKSLANMSEFTVYA